MPIWDRDLQIKKYDPRVLLHSLRHSLAAYLETLRTQLALNGVQCSNVKTIKLTIGGVGVTGCDFNFVTAANTSEQIINLGAVIPALARVVDVKTHTETGFHANSTTLVAEIGNSSSGHEFVGSATIMALNAVNKMAHDHFFTVAPAAAASNVYVAATPGANWSNATLGKVAVYITYIEI
jgi:hypothetical protein